MLPPGVLEMLLTHAEERKRCAGAKLSDREQEVLLLMAEGAANKEIASKLTITERTVKAHVTGILNKLGVNSRTEAVAVAIRSGLVPKNS